MGAFERERRLAMAKNYLLLAWSAPPRSRGVWENILRALSENPASLLTPSLLGLIPRAIRGHRHNG